MTDDRGWHEDYERHAMARMGIKTAVKNPSVRKLIPKTISQKSFGGKAIERAENGKIILKSYATDVAYIDENGKAHVKGLYSDTTKRHIFEFLKQHGFKAESSAQILADYGTGSKVVSTHIPTKSVYVKTDGWRGHEEFPNSVYDTWASGEYEDAGGHKGSEVRKKIAFIQSVLKDAGIPSKVKTTETSNVFSQGVDVLVAPANVEKAKQILKERNF